jgi:hypothetical protein
MNSHAWPAGTTGYILSVGETAARNGSASPLVWLDHVELRPR